MNDEIFRALEIQEGGTTKTISTLRAVTQKLVTSALEGNYRAAQWVLGAARALEAAQAAEQETDYQYGVAYKARLEDDPFRFLHGGSNDAIPIPNPNNVILDERHRKVMFSGPRNREEVAMFDEAEAEAEAEKRRDKEKGKPTSQPLTDEHCVTKDPMPDNPIGPVGVPSTPDNCD